MMPPTQRVAAERDSNDVFRPKSAARGHAQEADSTDKQENGEQQQKQKAARPQNLPTFKTQRQMFGAN
jgi:hypothetical protein